MLSVHVFLLGPRISICDYMWYKKWRQVGTTDNISMGCSRAVESPTSTDIWWKFCGGYYFKLSSQPCSLRRAHTDPFPLAMRVVQALVMLLGILVDKFPMNSNTSTDFFGGFKKVGSSTLQGTNISHLWKRNIIFKNTFLGTGYVLLPRRASCLGISRAVFV